MYYSHPILNVLAEDFNTTQAGVADIPTLALAGSVTGLLLVLPLGDFFPRRTFTLTLMIVAIAFWYGKPFSPR
jgi:predicted MFS family arabinose efflux permease